MRRCKIRVLPFSAIGRPDRLRLFLVTSQMSGDAFADVVIVACDTARDEVKHASTKPLDGIHVVTYKQHGPTTCRNFAHLAETLLLKFRVADRKHLVNDKN